MKPFRQSTTPVGATKLMIPRSSLIKNMETLLSSWIEDTNQHALLEKKQNKKNKKAVIMAKA